MPEKKLWWREGSKDYGHRVNQLLLLGSHLSSKYVCKLARECTHIWSQCGRSLQ